MKILVGRTLVDTSKTRPVAVMLSDEEAKAVILILQQSLQQNRDNRNNYIFWCKDKTTVEQQKDMMQVLQTEPM